MNYNTIKNIYTQISDTIHKYFFIVPVIILLIYIVIGILAPYISPYSPYDIKLMNRLLPPFSENKGYISILGTDALGRDFLSRMMYGTMISFKVTISVSIINTVIGSAIGIMSGYFGGWIDKLLMRFTDMAISIPWIVVVFCTAAILGPSFASVIIAMSLFGWSNLARTLRMETMKLKNADFVLQARISGSSVTRIVFKHLLPNLMNIVIILTTMSVPYIILTEGILSFIGIGIPTVNPSWGTLINEGRNFFFTAWWIPLLPAIAIFLVVYSSMYIGDRLQDRLNPEI